MDVFLSVEHVCAVNAEILSACDRPSETHTGSEHVLIAEVGTTGSLHCDVQM